MSVKKLRNAMKRGRKIAVIKEDGSVHHRKGSTAAKASQMFARKLQPYLAGKVARGDLVAAAAKSLKISEATASSYLHNFVSKEVRAA